MLTRGNGGTLPRCRYGGLSWNRGSWKEDAKVCQSIKGDVVEIGEFRTTSFEMQMDSNDKNNLRI